MNILIVENNVKELTDLFTLLHNFEKNQDTPLNISTESNYDKIVSSVDLYDVIFFDIELNNGMNGITLARKIRERNKDVRIIFITNYARYSISGYEAKADLYLLKPVNQEEFNQKMANVLWDYIYSNLGIIDTRLKQTKLYFHNILYIEMLQRKVIIHLKNEENVSCYDTLLQWKNILKDAPFSQPHRSFLVNMQHIQKYEEDYIVMKDNIQIPITKIFKDEFRENYIRYLNRRIYSHDC